MPNLPQRPTEEVRTHPAHYLLHGSVTSVGVATRWNRRKLGAGSTPIFIFSGTAEAAINQLRGGAD
eukprot:11740316-Prorocentrum_lima.AAC.1